MYDEKLIERLSEVFELDHWWVTDFRGPRVYDFHTRWAVPVAQVAGSQEETPLWRFLEPSREDVELVSKYIRYRNAYWFAPHYIKAMDEKAPIDLDPGVNTKTIAHMEHSWVYRMMTWEAPPFSPPFSLSLMKSLIRFLGCWTRLKLTMMVR
jgi:hypothetical protein